MGDFAQGVIAGNEQQKSNPFNLILGKFQEAQARRYSEDMMRHKEEADLSKALQVLSYQKTYEGELAKEKAKEEKQNILLKGQAEGKIQPTDETGAGTFEGTPFGATGQRFKAIGQVKSDPKAFERFNDALDPTKTVRSPLGIAKIAYDKAERLQSLSNAFPDGNLDSRQIEELAIGFNSLLQGGAGGGGGGSSEKIISALVPKSAVGNAMKLKEWLTNNPQGMQQQEFVKRMMGTVEREKATTAAQIKRVQFSRIAAFQGLEKKDPEQFGQVLMSWGVDPQEYQTWKDSGYKQADASKAGLNSNPFNALNPKQGQYQEGQTATNPTTKEKMIYRGGKWQAM